MTKEALSGRLSRAPKIGAPRTQQEDIVLRRSGKATAFLRDYATFEEWRQMAGEFLKRRGPKVVR